MTTSQPPGAGLPGPPDPPQRPTSGARHASPPPSPRPSASPPPVQPPPIAAAPPVIPPVQKPPIAPPAPKIDNPTGKSAEPSMGQLVSEASTHLSTLIHSEIELAKLELRSSVKNAGVGIGMFGAALVVLIFSLTFGFLALAEGINALGLDRWLSFLIVFVFMLLLVGAFAFLGLKKVKRVKAPEKTIKTSKETVAYLKNHG